MRRKREAGQAIVAVALGLVVLVGALGLGIDFGYLRYQKRQMQTAADAAAIAAAAMLDFGNSTSMTTAATTMTAKNGFTNGTNGVVVHVYNPPTDLPAGQGAGQDPNNGNSKFVSVVVSQNQPTFFAKAFGVTSVPLSARAEGAEGGGNNCIFALDPTGTGLAVDFLAAITSQCGIVVESSGGSALQCGLFAALNASSIGVVGGVSDFLCGINPNPNTGINVPSPADPLASTPAPSTAGCGSSTGGTVTSGTYTGTSAKGLNVNPGGTVTLNPGIYCGGIKANFGAKINLNAGTYVLKNATSGSTYGLTVDLGTTINGTGVTFYNYGTSGAITFSFSSFTTGGVNLVAPTSGTYEGMLFIQPSANTQEATIIGSSSFNTILQGTYYFPGAKVLFAFDGLVDYDILDAYQIEFEILTLGGTTVQGNFSNNYSTLANGSPVKGGDGVLVE